MGAAAYNRGSRVIARLVSAPAEKLRQREHTREAIRVSEELDVWRRDALAMLADPAGEHRPGFLSQCVDSFREDGDRVYSARLRKVTEAHGRWIDADTSDAFGYLKASREYAQAVYRLLEWASGQYKNPCLETAPKSARA